MRALIVLLSLTLALPARAAEEALILPPPAVTVAPARAGTIVDTSVLTGTLVPREEVMVSPRLEGLAITQILVEEGERVTTGQVLARLSRDLLETTLAQNTAAQARADASIAQARAQIAEAQASRTQADLALARTRELIGGGAASRETLEQRQMAAVTSASRVAAAQSLLLAAEAERASAEAQRQDTLVRLSRTDIQAPVAGTVSRRTARLGAIASAAGEPLFRIIAASQVEMEADVPETELARLRPGQDAQVTAAGMERPGKVPPGKVRLVSPEVSKASRLGRVRISVEGEGLVIGAFARATVEIARHEGVLVPLSAVLQGRDGAIVQVVRDNLVDTRRVRLGLRDTRRAEVLDGLAEGEQVVAVSGTFVRDGDRVTPVPVAMPVKPDASAAR